MTAIPGQQTTVEVVDADFGGPTYHLRFVQPIGPPERGPVTLEVAVPGHTGTIPLSNAALRSVGNGNFTPVATIVERAYTALRDDDREVFLAAVRLAAYNAYVALAARAGVVIPAAPLPTATIAPAPVPTSVVSAATPTGAGDQRSLFDAAATATVPVALSAVDPWAIPAPAPGLGVSPVATIDAAPVTLSASPSPEEIPVVAASTDASEEDTTPGSPPGAPAAGSPAIPANPTLPIAASLLRFTAMRGAQGFTQTVAVEPAGDEGLVATAYANAPGIWAALDVGAAHGWLPTGAVGRMVAMRDRAGEPEGAVLVVVTEDRAGVARFAAAVAGSVTAGIAMVAPLLAAAQAAFARPSERFIKPGSVAGKTLTPKGTATPAASKAKVAPARTTPTARATVGAAASTAPGATTATITTGELPTPTAPDPAAVPAAPAVTQRSLF